MKKLKITVTPTNDWIEIGGVPHRMWDGQTASGIPVQAAIASIAPIRGNDYERFAAECASAGLLPPRGISQC